MRIISVTLAALLAATPALAAEGPLPPGKPAGVRPAVSKRAELVYMGLGVLAAGGLGLLLLGKNNGGISLNLAATSTSP